jgi:hypothetical protein
MNTLHAAITDVIDDNLDPLWRRVPVGLPFGWILEGEDEDGTARCTDAYDAMEQDPACAWALGWLQGTAEALDMTRAELLDAAEINLAKVKR